MQDSQYLHQPALLQHILDRTCELKFPMASEPLVGALLRSLAASKPRGTFLELGTGTGISTAWILDGMSSGSTLVSVDTDADVQQVAVDYLGRDTRLKLILEDGNSFLEHQSPATYDLVFADAMPGKYEGLEKALVTVKPGGFYVIDDMRPQPNWPEGHAAKVPVLLQQLAANEDFAVAPIVWASGVVVAVRRS
jgi:predicted O-methyltransferase YrrM